jgi:hypothetical protein
MASRMKKPVVEKELINAVLRKAEVVLDAASAFFQAYRIEIERVAREAVENQDTPEVLRAREQTLLKKMEAEREEFEARIAIAQAQKKRIAAQAANMGRQPQQSVPRQNSTRPPHHKSEAQRRIEQRREPLKGGIKGLDQVDRASLPAATQQPGEAASSGTSQ